MVWKTGKSKTTNKDYAFWACNLRADDGGFCKGKPVLPEVPTVKIDEDEDVIGKLRQIKELVEDLINLLVNKDLSL